jgi:Ca-activated chloride channel family protein
MRRLTTLTTLLTLTAGCNDMGMRASYDMSGDLGVTPGGSQDVSLAREIIEDGGIPDQGQFTAQGLFSEHDLPLSGKRCRKVLCPRAAAALTKPVNGTGKRLLVQLGFGTKIKAETFERRPLNLSIALDVSGSMTGAKIDTVRAAMLEMVERLDEADTVSLVLFNSQSQTVMAPTSMNEGGRSLFTRAIQQIQAGGSTDIEAGLQDAYDHINRTEEVAGVERRVMLLTDAQPNMGGTDIHSFTGMARHHSEAGIGLSVFGVGLDLGSELASRMSSLPGGNSFFLADEADIRAVFNEEFEYWVTPLAYDLDVRLTIDESMRIDKTWATPTDPTETGLGFGASTLFLSSKRGGMGISLDYGEAPEEGDPLADFELSFETLRGKAKSDRLKLSFEGGTEISDGLVKADDLGVYKMAYLVDVLIAMKSASDFCDDTLPLEDALVHVDKAGDRLERVAESLEDPDMQREAEMMRMLAENLRVERPYCAQASSPYGY